MGILTIAPALEPDRADVVFMQSECLCYLCALCAMVGRHRGAGQGAAAQAARGGGGARGPAHQYAACMHEPSVGRAETARSVGSARNINTFIT